MRARIVIGGASSDAGSADAGTDAAIVEYSDLPYTSSGPPEPSDCLRRAGTFVGPNDTGYTAQWSPTADYLLAGTLGALRLLAVNLDAESVEEVATFNHPEVQVYGQWSPDGKYAVSAGQDVRLIRIDVEPPTITEVARYTGHTQAVIAVAWSPDGQSLLTAAKDGTVRVLAVDREWGSLEERALSDAHVGRVFAVSWSPDGRHVLSMGEDQTMRLLALDAEAGTLTELTHVDGADWENSVAWAAGDRPVLSGDWGLLNQVEMWSVDVAGGTLSSQGVLTQFDHVGVQVLEWNAKGTLLAAAAHDDNRLQLFSYAKHHFEGLGSLTGWLYGVHAASWSRAGTHLAIAAAYGERVTILDVRDCLPIRKP